MKDLQQPLPSFLSTYGLFQHADRRVKETSPELLTTQYSKEMLQKHWGSARTIALKLVLLCGLEKLRLYVPAEIASIREEKNKSEIVNQEIIQLLGLLKFLEKQLEPGTDLEWLQAQENECFKLCDEASKPGVTEEIDSLVAYYENKSHSP